MDKRLLKILTYIAYSLPYIFVFLAAIYIPKDPDLGWHLKYGEYFFLHHSILRDNIFSSTMQNYHWANESWGTDIITYLIYRSGGFFALSIAAAFITALTFFFFIKAGKLTYAVTVISSIIFSYLFISMNINSFRGQQISFLFLGILFYILSKYKPGSKILFSIPVLFLIWVNIHGESFLGIAILAIYLLLKLIQDFIKEYPSRETTLKELKHFAIIFLLSSLATVLNPWGIQTHLFALSHFSNPLLFKVNEYIPFQNFTVNWWNQIIYSVLIFSGIIFLMKKRKFIDYLPIIIITLVLAFVSLQIQRYVWPAYYISIILFGAIWNEIKFPKNKYSLVIPAIISIISILFILQVKMPLSKYLDADWNTYCSIKDPSCSPKASEFIVKNKLKNIFTYYDWGGWIIWNYPQFKPNIDGRMLVWRDKNGFSETEEYNDLINSNKKIDKSRYDYVYIPNLKSPLYLEMSDLIDQNKWQIIYEDDKSFVLKRVN